MTASVTDERGTPSSSLRCGMPGGASLGAIAFDCPDPLALAAFYAALMGEEVGFSTDTFAAFKVNGLWVSMHRVDDYRPPKWPDPDAPQQMHLDLAVDDLDAGELRAIELGATKADPQPSPASWRVMLDPAGHPFCLSPASSFP
jgi:hypothetical protein